jgi:hypothetical protein
MNVPTHKSEQTGNAPLDRIQNNVRELVAFVRSLAWLANRAYVQLEQDVTIPTSAVYTILVSTTIKTSNDASHIVANFSASGAKLTAVGTVYFRLVVDDVVVGSTSLSVNLTWVFNASLVARAAVRKGAHAVRIEWWTDSSSATIRAKSLIWEHAHLSLHEEP